MGERIESVISFAGGEKAFFKNGFRNWAAFNANTSPLGGRIWTRISAKVGAPGTGGGSAAQSSRKAKLRSIAKGSVSGKPIDMPTGAKKGSIRIR